jgi:hypothetical protein
MLKTKNRRGQIALWVIIAIVIVAGVLMMILLKKNPLVPTTLGENDFQAKIEKCAKDSVNSAIDIMLPQGGFLQPTNFKVYKNTNISYLCQNIGYFKPCINQHPMLINEEVSEIENYAKPKTENCFQTAKSEFEKNGYSVSMDNMQFNITLASDRVFLNIHRKVVLSKDERIESFEDFNININNPIYDLSKVAIEISNQEAKYCYFEYVGYMMLYPRFGIKKFAMSDSTKIYTVIDKYSNKEINFATRSCAIPPGI